MTGSVLAGQQNFNVPSGASSGRDRSVGAIRSIFDLGRAEPERHNPSDFHRSFGQAASEIAYKASLQTAESVELPYLEQRPGGGLLSTSAQILLAETRTREAGAKATVALLPSGSFREAGDTATAGRALGAYRSAQAQVDATIRSGFGLG
ncbi:hypothetical protein [Gimibacter soli]|uniref:Uncharacterized protein n=1 Tax=Gimibacter soli TaxID=3024400 RepID=A0AAE9XU57_9PROT|nr:hypothetical protein [Gimibacter soli]WCL54996.1 hypothetical protein PH603_04390 [Gimibacter soli]